MTGHRGVPSTRELVAAVREFLHGEVMPGTEGRLNFNARVAVNVLAIVERELERGSEVEAAHRRRLASFGMEDDAALAAAIRHGRIELSRELLHLLRRDAAARLAIANPRHLLTNEPFAPTDPPGAIP